MANLTTSWTDDDGSGTLGTILNNAQLQAIWQNTGHADNRTCCGRVTLSTGVPVTTADVTAATTLYFSPYGGDVIVLFDGSANWIPVSFSEISIGVPGTTSQMYDVFVYNNNGTATLELLAWTNDTTRATALVLQNGVYVKSGATTRRYVGSFRTTGSSGQTEDSAVKRYVWNYYNRIPRLLQRFESTVSWTYNTATVRQANGAAANQVETVVGIQESLLDLVLVVGVANSTGGINVSAGIGENSTTTYAAGAVAQGVANNLQSIVVRLTKYPAIGRNVYSWNEWSAVTATTTFYANVSSVGSTVQGGLNGSLLG